MNLYKGYDYKKMSKGDELLYNAVKKSEIRDTPLRRINKYHEYPKSGRHYESLFPNNYLDIEQLKNQKYITGICKQFKELLKKNPSEREMLNFINENEYYVIIASIFKLFNFGHHAAYLFKEFPISTSYRADYLLVGKGSGGYEFVFVELEHPSKETFLDSGDLAESYRKGINQVNDWRRFLDNGFQNLSEQFNKAKKTNDTLPYEFLITDSTRRHYVVIAGKREHYQKNEEKAYEIRRNEEKTS